ncbi:hypothetical protein C5B42_01015 [Candidatus Cerribacteria bacterium 'Amazon FNV 2010 28 9']|uniref:Uncharacterized protein n=1 Tax=Candidatus Cerribacteria bacterium 'Amazon FNV 2010 28 9' TaxID=2081795 RepID=A0A317JQB2_9BACT|nr:MAG: hypothetical protein C5B42_01015 [Candidatus Cerribacteria bacterium 'Amazon FNV 2010 28 9']
MAAVALMVVGIVIGFGGFVFAASNMASFGGEEGFDGMFGNHIKAMIVVALGGVLFLIGLVLLAYQLLQPALAK